MDQRRVGRSLRVLRRARSLRQSDIAFAAGVSQATVSAVERGRWDAMPLRVLRSLFAVLDADVEMVVRFRGGEIDRLLDERHAAIAARLAGDLRRAGWTVRPEVTFNHYGDRGSIDLLALHAAARALLVVEVKTEIASAEEMLRRLDVKARVAPRIAAELLDVRVERTVRLLAIRESTTNRERVARLEPLLEPAFPFRGGALRRWLRKPGVPRESIDEAGHSGTPVGALMFVRDNSPADRMRASRQIRASRTPGVIPGEAERREVSDAVGRRALSRAPYDQPG